MIALQNIAHIVHILVFNDNTKLKINWIIDVIYGRTQYIIITVFY